MAFQSVKELTGKGRYGRSRVSDSDLVFACHEATRKDSQQERMFAVVFRFSDALCKVAGIKTGDKLDVLFDKDSHMGLIRKSVDGWSASLAGKTLVMKIMFRPGLPSIKDSAPCEGVEARRDGIYFFLPPDAVWSERCAREEHSPSDLTESDS